MLGLRRSCLLTCKHSLVIPRVSREIRSYTQVTLRRNPSPDPRTDAALAAGLASPQLVEGASALFLGRAHYGCVATVLPPNTVGLTRQVRVTQCCRQSARLLAGLQ